LTVGETDNDLVAKSLQGNQKAFRQLIERHHATAYAVVRGVLGDRDGVEDVLQQVYIKIFKGLGGFRGDAQLSTWIYRIARNQALDFVQKKRLDTTPIDDVALAVPDADGPAAALESRDMSACLDQAMSKLDENHRMALELRYMGQRSYEEISVIMGVPLGTVKTYIYRGKAELKKVVSRRKDLL